MYEIESKSDKGMRILKVIVLYAFNKNIVRKVAFFFITTKITSRDKKRSMNANLYASVANLYALHKNIFNFDISNYHKKSNFTANSNGCDFILRSHSTARVGCEKGTP